MDEAVNRRKGAGGNAVGEMPKQQANTLDAQREHLERTFSSWPGMFGDGSMLQRGCCGRRWHLQPNLSKQGGDHERANSRWGWRRD